MTHAITPKVLAAIAALAVTSSGAYAAPAAKTVPVKMSDQKLDSVVAGGGMDGRTGSRFTVVCSLGNNCNGNGGSYNGNSFGLLNIANGNFAGSAILSGNSFLSGNFVR
jgi:hypothetical protein